MRPWERQPREATRSFARFVVYRDLPPEDRSLRLAANRLGVPLGTLQALNHRWSWSARVEAWDDERDRVKRQAMLQERIEMGRRQATAAAALQHAMMLPVSALLARVHREAEEYARDGHNVERTVNEILSGADLGTLLGYVYATAKVYPMVMRAERIARGEPVEGVEIEDVLPVEEPASILSDEEHSMAMLAALEDAGVRPMLQLVPPPEDVDAVG